MRVRTPQVALACATGLLSVSMTACAEGADERAPEHGMAQAADESACRADVAPLRAPYGPRFPQAWPFPPGTTVYHYEDRGQDGRIVTATSSTGFHDVLAFMNHEVVDAGFHIEDGETEEHDAEAEWAGNGYRGRWAIRESGSCPGETVIQVLAAEAE